MTVKFSTGYTLPSGDYPLTHARIAHSLNWLSGGTATASATGAGYYADAPTTFQSWEYDHGSAAECDYCCIAAHNLGTAASDLYIQYWNGSAWVSLVEFFNPVSTDEPIMVIFEPVKAQRWRIAVNNSSSVPEIGVIKFGSAMQMERPLYGGHAPIPMARQTILRSNYSETGEYLGRVKQRSYLITEYAWQHLSSTWVRANWPSFQLATEAEPFWIAWRPGTFGDVGYCQLDEVPVPSNMGIRDLMEVSMSVRARGYE
jgi:hypothetical protein